MQLPPISQSRMHKSDHVPPAPASHPPLDKAPAPPSACKALPDLAYFRSSDVTAVLDSNRPGLKSRLTYLPRDREGAISPLCASVSPLMT